MPLVNRKESHSNAQRYTLIWVLLFFTLLIFSATRIYLFYISLPNLDLISWAPIKIFSAGLIYDLAFISYLFIPFILYIGLLPSKLWNSFFNKLLVGMFLYAYIAGLLFVAIAEYLFWQEFGVRFNFISVDYLVYRQEVTDNILQSYPTTLIFSAILLISSALWLLAWPFLKHVFHTLDTFKHRATISILFLVLPLVSYLMLDQKLLKISPNTYENNLATNGSYQFFAAFRNNELNYNQFYYSIDQTIASNILKNEITEKNTHFNNNDLFNIGRHINNPGIESHPNIMLIMVESLSANFLNYFNNENHITPNLDKLIEKSLFFTNLYATGTRTTRGLEAVTLSIPPTPGRSIVKRINRESNMYSLGNILKEKGYDTEFIYGGRGFFDNMNAFFSGNGYGVIDQSNAPENLITYKNAWGMADENLFDLALRVADSAYSKNQPFFYHIMTTSNHRPYTYPDNRIDIPSGSSRNGAVKYTDYSINLMLENAKHKPWFNNTIFVIVADHTAGSAGKQALPLENYHIPMWIYAPNIIPAKKVTTIASQIDIAPTLLALMNMDYNSWFFGKNILSMSANEERSLIGNYQNLGLYQAGTLTILSPTKEIHQRDKFGNTRQTVDSILKQDTYLNRATAFYQGADYIYRKQLNIWQKNGKHSTVTEPRS